MRDCAEYRLWISELLDGELGEEERGELRKHLARCPDCAAVYEAFYDLSGAMEQEVLPEGLHERIMAPVLASLPKKKAPWLMSALSAAACFAAIAASLMILRPAYQSRETTASGGAAVFGYSSADAAPAEAEENGVMEARLYDAADAGAGAKDAGTAYFDAAPEAVPKKAEPREAETPAAAMAEADSEEAIDWRETALFLHVTAAREDGTAAAEVLEDPTGLFTPGQTLTLIPPEGETLPEAETLRVDFSRWDAENGVISVYAEQIEAE